MGLPRAVIRTVLLDAVAVVLGVACYFGVRGQTAGSPDVAVRHAADVLALERHSVSTSNAGCSRR